jgi:glutamate racemase
MWGDMREFWPLILVHYSRVKSHRRVIHEVQMKLGIIDWGIGGLDCMARIRAQCPHLDITYFSDSGYTPYGRVPPGELSERVATVVDMIAVDHVIVACNAASTILPKTPLSIPVQGVIEHGVEAVLATTLGRVGVIGGQRTIESGAYGQPLRAAGCTVWERVAQPLSALIEAGRLDGPEVVTQITDILSDLGQIECLVLACTHYPALVPLFERLLPGVLLVDPMDTLVTRTMECWSLDTQLGTGHSMVWTTGSIEQTRRSAKGAFGLDVGAIRLWR